MAARQVNLDRENDDKNFDDGIQVSSYKRTIADI